MRQNPHGGNLQSINTLLLLISRGTCNTTVFPLKVQCLTGNKQQCVWRPDTWPIFSEFMSLTFSVTHLELRFSHAVATSVLSSSEHRSRSKWLQSKHKLWLDTACEILWVGTGSLQLQYNTVDVEWCETVNSLWTENRCHWKEKSAWSCTTLLHATTTKASLHRSDSEPLFGVRWQNIYS